MTVSVKASQRVIPPPNYLDISPAILPIQDSILFEGILMVMIVLDQVEDQEQSIDIYLELA